MIGRCFFLLLALILVHLIITYAYTDLVDVQALQDLYLALNRPQQLKGWRMDGGDPCEDPWEGISCNGSSVIHIKLADQNLTGYLGFQLSKLTNLMQLDASYNRIEGEIPYILPPNMTHLNLAFNNFTQSIPYSISSLKYLRHLNLSHNSLSGSVGDIFASLAYLREIDFSYNNLTGDLPSSFGSLIRLTKLFLQSNGFTGSVVSLTGLPLTHLDIQDNHFSGILPHQFQSIPNLWIGSNRFAEGINYPAWDFPWDNIHNETNMSISSPPTTESSAIESYPSHEEGDEKKKHVGPNAIAFMIGGAALVVFCAGLVLVVHLRRSHLAQSRKRSAANSSEVSPYSLPVRQSRGPQSLKRSEKIIKVSRDSLPISSTARVGLSSTPPETSPVISALHTPVGTHSNLRTRMKSLGVSRKRILNRNDKLVGVKLYTVTELQKATNFFSNDNLIGYGSLGPIYKGEFLNRKIYAVKNIEMLSLSPREEEEFLDVIWNASRLKHLNIVKLVGCCLEHGQHFLVYEYVRNLSLFEALHREEYIPLSWGLRTRIALGIARALNYLHSTCVPPVAHGNLKAANVLLDEDLMPHICDCGLAALKPLASNAVELEESETAICDSGYIAPDQVQPGKDNCIKGDIYAFGVLLLELFTGRKPFDSTKPREEQHLVKWAWSQLHDNESLEQMVDPGIKKTISSKALSRFADIVSLCIQPDKEFRPPMSEIVEPLVFLLQENHTRGRSVLIEGTECNPSEFCTANTQFLDSPNFSCRSN